MNPSDTVHGTWLTVALRWAVGLVFLLAGSLKIADPAGFATSVENYRVLPHELINLVAITVPWVELVVGLLLFAGVWVRANAVIATAMTIVFGALVVSALVRNLNIECGCFGTLGGRRIGLVNLAIDGGLLGLAAWLARRARDYRQSHVMRGAYSRLGR